jgi:deoxyguanosine kinase
MESRLSNLKSPYNFIAIEGNIGAGKTSLAKMISKDLNARLILEQFEDNSFLPKFYQDQSRYAFPLELSFLAERFQQLKDILPSQDLFTNFTLSDYFINKSLIFARKTLQADEFMLYGKLFNIMNLSLPKPDLLVYLYLNIEKLQLNIRKRGRDYEQNMRDEYLQEIQESYFEFISHQTKMRILIIDTNNVDFVNNESDYKKILQLILQEYPEGVHRVSI